MRSIFSIIGIILGMFFTFLAIPAWGDKALDAYLNRNYSEAFAIWKPRAEMGNVQAQINIKVVSSENT